MTEEQLIHIKSAAKELMKALNEANVELGIEIERINMATICTSNFAYNIKIVKPMKDMVLYREEASNERLGSYV